MNNRGRILIVDFTDYEDYPIGGYLTFAKNLMESFGSELALAGITTSKKDPVGKWFRKSINGTEYDFFAMIRYNRSRTRNIIPDRIVNLILANYFKRRILQIGIDNLFVQRQESLIAFANTGKNICYSFPGLENPLDISKYSYAGLMAKMFEKKFFKRLAHVNTILARGDDDAIREMVARSNGAMVNQPVIKFPTRVRTDIFKPMDKKSAREMLGLPPGATIVLTTGRLAWLKGWKFMIDSFVEFSKKVTDPLFLFVGEGEDYDEIMLYISEKNLTGKISLAGKKSREEIALYLNASDVYIMGSYKEGWPTALMEAAACGVPACVTDFSAADEIIRDGVNGYIVKKHDEEVFAETMLKVLSLPRPLQNDHVTRYSTDNLKSDILNYWKLQ